MERSRDLKDQMGGLVSEMFLCFRHTIPNRQFQVLLLLWSAFYGAHVEAVIREPGPGGEKKIEARVRKGIPHHQKRDRRPVASPKGIVRPK